MSTDWQRRIEEYCRIYNIPIQSLADILYEPKVTPMIRGKGFEYTVMATLQNYLPENEWMVSKASIREEASFHDTDVRVFHKRTGRAIRVECKLADKESYRLRSNGDSAIRVKCMRSRTLGVKRVRELAPRLGVSEDSLSVHNDQYLPADFDFVITTIGNAFYRTDPTTGLYQWTPTERETEFLSRLQASSDGDLKDATFNNIFIAGTRGLAARSDTGVVCTRRNCTDNTNCGFVPNYPAIAFDSRTQRPVQPWVTIEECADIFRKFVTS